MWQRIKNVYHLLNAFVANIWFGFPSSNLTVIGVTGTDGKTTTVNLIYHILHEAGYNASMISSVGAVIGGKEYDVGFHVTTPSPWALQGFIKKIERHSGEESRSAGRRLQNLSEPFMVKGDSGRSASWRIARMTMDRKNYLVLEVTSHALDQYRVWGIKFDIGVLTNVTHEHLDYHKTYENYVKTKAKLLKMARVAVVNRDDNSFTLVKSEIRNPKSEINSKFKNQKFITYGMNKDAEINPKKFPFKTNLIGEFNRYNVLAAVAACRGLGISDQIIREAILTFKPPIGREEIVFKNSFTVMVDFAHTPNAFEEILSSIKNPPSSRSAGLRSHVAKGYVDGARTRGKLIHVFGAAGERDATKRSLMGKASAKYSDIIILTAEDPRSESVDKIMEEIVSGIDDRRWKVEDGGRRLRIENRLFKIADRQEAIRVAIGMARRGDFVIITGKSHEKSMNYGKGEMPWDEFGAVKKALSSSRK